MLRDRSANLRLDFSRAARSSRSARHFSRSATAWMRLAIRSWIASSGLLLGSNFRPHSAASRASGSLSRARQEEAARYQALTLRGLSLRAEAQSLLQEP